VRSLGDNASPFSATTTCTCSRSPAAAIEKRKSDTLDAIFTAPDRDDLLGWLIAQAAGPLTSEGDLMVHAGLVPQWTVGMALSSRTKSSRPCIPTRALFENMYGDEPRRWSDSLTGMDRLRFHQRADTRCVCARPTAKLT
jgi:bis(5'-nucleosyl)-tetraphosphatase (symmetrical)